MIPVKGVPDSMKRSAVSLSSWTSSSVKGCTHFSGLLMKSSLRHTVGPVISLGKAEYGFNSSRIGGCWPEVRMPSGKISRGALWFLILSEVLSTGSWISAPGAMVTKYDEI